MGRAKGNPIKELAILPWPVGVVFGVGGFLAIRFLLPMFLRGNQFAPIVVAFVPLSWMVLAIGLLAAVMSWVREQQRRKLLDAQQGLESIAALGWRHFEQLVGEAFRRQGYAVEETGLGGADGGIDLILRKDGRCVLVQCKQSRNRQVGVKVVREMAGLLDHHRAAEVKIVCLGTYTADGAEFVRGKPIELIGGEQLLRMIREVQSAPAPAKDRVAEPVQASQMPDTSPACPHCGKAMVERTNRNTGQKFWGCSAFPVCRGVG